MSGEICVGRFERLHPWRGGNGFVGCLLDRPFVSVREGYQEKI